MSRLRYQKQNLTKGVRKNSETLVNIVNRCKTHKKHTKTHKKMGFSISKIFDSYFGQPEYRILMLGLDAAGKTTITYKLKIGETVTTLPTIGFGVETIQFKNVKFNVWDIGGSHIHVQRKKNGCKRY